MARATRRRCPTWRRRRPPSSRTSRSSPRPTGARRCRSSTRSPAGSRRCSSCSAPRSPPPPGRRRSRSPASSPSRPASCSCAAPAARRRPLDGDGGRHRGHDRVLHRDRQERAAPRRHDPVLRGRARGPGHRLRRRALGRPRPRRGPCAASRAGRRRRASAMFGAYGLVLAALRLAPAAPVAAVRETSVVMATALAAIFLHEHVSRARAARRGAGVRRRRRAGGHMSTRRRGRRRLRARLRGDRLLRRAGDHGRGRAHARDRIERRPQRRPPGRACGRRRPRSARPRQGRGRRGARPGAGRRRRGCRGAGGRRARPRRAGAARLPRRARARPGRRRPARARLAAGRPRSRASLRS